MRFSSYLLIITYICLFFVKDINVAIAQCDDPDAPEFVRIYFANGMNNKPNDRFDSRLALEVEVGVSSSRSYGNSVNTKEGFFRQLLQVAAQKDTEPKIFWEWIADLSLAPEWFQQAFNDHMTLVSSVSYALDAELRIMVNEYLQDLNSGKMVIIVSHSQGNFYANSAYQYIYDNYQGYRNSIGIVAVGSPAARVQDEGPYTNNSMDLILNLTRTLYYVLPATGTYDEPGSVLNHNFINTYLEAFGLKIRNDILQTISRLQAPEKTFECKDPDEVPVEVITVGASNISSTSAFLGGFVQSGKQISVRCLWRKAEYGLPSSCWDYTTDSFLSSGSFDTEDRFYCVASGLSSNTSYNYRVCGREGERISDGGVVNFKTNITCGSPLSASGGSDGLSVKYGMGATAGYVSIEFEAYNIPDKLEIYQGETHILTSNGYVSGLNTASVWHNPAYGQEWDVYVYGNADAGTAWDLDISCPEN